MRLSGETQMRKTYFVTASHPCADDFCFDRKEVRVSQDRLDGTFYADTSKLGCGRNAATVEEAIRSLFASHACAVTKIEEV